MGTGTTNVIDLIGDKKEYRIISILFYFAIIQSFCPLNGEKIKGSEFLR